MYARGHVSCWPDLVIKSTVEPKRCLILDFRKSSLEVDRRVLENRDEFPFSLPSCLYWAIFSLLLLCLPLEFSFARKPIVTEVIDGFICFHCFFLSELPKIQLPALKNPVFRTDRFTVITRNNQLSEPAKLPYFRGNGPPLSTQGVPLLL